MIVEPVVCFGGSEIDPEEGPETSAICLFLKPPGATRVSRGTASCVNPRPFEGSLDSRLESVWRSIGVFF